MLLWFRFLLIWFRLMLLWFRLLLLWFRLLLLWFRLILLGIWSIVGEGIQGELRQVGRGQVVVRLGSGWV